MGKRRNPFKPGAGRRPPVRAGHEDIVEVLDEKLADVLEDEVGDVVVLYGPRGNGKTTLLLELEHKAKEKKAAIRKRTPSQLMGSIEEIASTLIDESGTKFETSASIEASLGFAKGKLTVSPTQTARLVSALRTLAKSAPVVLLIDEAHKLHAEIGAVLLNAVQTCHGEGLRLFVVLAGTPGLEENMRKMGASFWERYERLRVGRLESSDDVRAALSIPASKSGLPFDEEALDLLVDESQGYPYFIQMLGKNAWGAADKAGHGRITLADARAGLGKSEPTRNAFYLSRRNEAEADSVLAEAEAVSKEIMRKGLDSELTEGELEVALEGVLGADVSAVRSAVAKLSNLGLIWQTPQATWVPGIPSLCRYLTSKSRRR